MNTKAEKFPMIIFDKVRQYLIPVEVNMNKVDRADQQISKALKAVVDGDEEWFCTSREKVKVNDCNL